MKPLYIGNISIDTVDDLKKLLNGHKGIKGDELRVNVVDSFVDGHIEGFLHDTGKDGLVARLKSIDKNGDDSAILRELVEIVCNETYQVDIDPFQYIEVLRTAIINNNKALFEIKVAKKAVESITIKIDIPQIGLSQSKTIRLSQYNIGEIVPLEINIPDQEKEHEIFFYINSNSIKTLNTYGNCIFQLKGVEFKMIRVEGGSFMMGSPDNDSVAEDDEKPQHRVTLSDYYIGETPVTVAQFRAFINETGYRTDADINGGSTIWNGSEWKKQNGVNWSFGVDGRKRSVSEDDHPVVHVSWNDAVAYCEWLKKKTGKQFALPTEAQWEFAARGGKKSNGFEYAGSNNIDEVAWYNKNAYYCGSSSGNYSHPDYGTHPVKSKKKNELGLYDMSGNVWEWCQDWYGDYKRGSQTNPTGSSSGSYRVGRGGGWYGGSKFCRLSYRSGSTPDGRGRNLGFRLALSE